MFNHLKNFQHFESFSDEELQKISKFLIPREISAGDFLTREGSSACSLFIIESGSVDILKHTLNGSYHHVGVASCGSIIGEVSLLGDNKRTADVVAKGNVRVLELSFSALDQIAKEDLDFGIRLYRTIAACLVEKLKNTTADFAELLVSSRLIELGQLTTTIMHEINNPLTAIELNTCQIEEEASTESPDLKVILELASSNAKVLKHISRILSGIQLVSRDAQRDVFIIANLKEIIDETLLLCQGKLKKYDIKACVRVNPSHLQIYCRPTQISQVLLNLINNACDALVDLNEKWIRIEAYETQNNIEISVTDSGKGIPTEIRDKIFQPFFTTKALGKGSGLGLSISQRIIESHKGKLILVGDSPYTCFKIQIPCIQDRE